MNRRDNRPNRHRQNHSAPRKSGNRETHSRTQRERNSNRGKSFQGKDNLGGDHVEGRQAVRELLLGGKRRVHRVVISEDVDDTAILAEISDICHDRRVPVQQISRRKLDEYALTESHQGVIAQADHIRAVEFDQLFVNEQKTPPLIVALDGVTDPRNLGAILRTCEVLGVDGVVLPRHRAARLTPSAVKAAAGAIEHLPIALVSGLPTTVKQVSESGMWVVGLDSDAKDSIHDLRVATEPLMVVLGAEGEGLSHLTKQRCDQLVSIPQIGQVSSLNVANATAITIYEINRRRKMEG